MGNFFSFCSVFHLVDLVHSVTYTCTKQLFLFRFLPASNLHVYSHLTYHSTAYFISVLADIWCFTGTKVDMFWVKSVRFVEGPMTAHRNFEDFLRRNFKFRIFKPIMVMFWLAVKGSFHAADCIRLAGLTLVIHFWWLSLVDGWSHIHLFDVSFNCDTTLNQWCCNSYLASRAKYCS